MHNCTKVLKYPFSFIGLLREATDDVVELRWHIHAIIPCCVVVNIYNNKKVMVDEEKSFSESNPQYGYNGEINQLRKNGFTRLQGVLLSLLLHTYI